MHARENDADIIVPRRGDKDFRASYPTEQYHSEQFANLFLDSLGNKIGLPSTDWTNGPFAFDASMATQWLEYDGEIRDAHLAPIVDCFLKDSVKITSFNIPYRHPDLMKGTRRRKPGIYRKTIAPAQLFVGHSWKTNEGGGGSRSNGKCDIKIATAKN